MEHHHHVEERVFFPVVRKIAGGRSVFFDDSLNQHSKIHERLMKLHNYTAATSKQPAEYRWETMKNLINSFALELHKHLNDEIDMLLSPRR